MTPKTRRTAIIVGAALVSIGDGLGAVLVMAALMANVE
ncbi:hypothetical protein BJ1_gp03 [Halorubrum virus BJ1]|uniref:Uncharacterized protein n=1 Tax=Halorubrum virus BJ1 TaxID=416419 RepID=A0ZYL6_9CAUD|nr:hypothetical protein BJ1_gp03 [Halorubrum virus BJ1]CAL92425.1 hypothetical protein [Halorubrum virus BJ1]